MAQSATVERRAIDESVSEAVVSAVSEFTGTDPVSLEPLYEAVDPDALNTLFGSDPGAPATPARRVTFAYSGCEVVVTADGEVAVSERE